MTMRAFFESRPHLSAVLALGIAVLGAASAVIVGRSDYPEVAPTIVQVATTYAGASPSVVSDTVATPIEDQINAVENVYSIDSRCYDSGFYELYVTFVPGSDPDMNVVNVQNAVKRAEPKLPSEVMQVGLTIQKCTSDYAIQFLFTTDGSAMNLTELGNFVNHEIKDVLQRVRGVSSVSCSDNEYAMRVWLDTKRMDALGLSVADVRTAIAGQNIQPAAGFVGNAMSSPFLSYKVNAPGRLVTHAEFEAIIVRTDPTDGSRIRLGDIARCELGSKTYTHAITLNGRPCYMALANADSEANTREVAGACRKAVSDWMAHAPKGVDWCVLHDQTDYIDEFLGNVLWFLAGAVALALILYGALTRFRRFFSAASIVSVSLLAGFILLVAIGWTLDAVTALAMLSGLLIALAVASGGATFSLALLVVAAFAPLAGYGGMVGVMFVRFASVTAVIAGVASFMAILFMRTNEFVGAPAVSAFCGLTSGLMRWAGILVASALLAATGFWIEKGFVPSEDKGIIRMEVELSEGSSLVRTSSVVSRVQELLADVPGIERIYVDAGNSAVTKVGENHAAVTIALRPWRERKGISIERVCADVERRLKSIATAKFYPMLQTPLRGTGGIGGCKIVLCAIGAMDPTELAADAEAYAEKFRRMPDVQNVVTTFSADTPQLFFSVDRDKAQALGVSVENIFSTLQSKLASFYVNDFNIDGCSRQVIVQNDYDGRNAVEDALQLRFPGANGEMVPLSSVGEFRHMLGASVITRQEKRMSAGIVIRPKEGVSTLELISRVEADPPDRRKYCVDYSTMTREEISSRGKFPKMVAIGLFFMYLVLVGTLESWWRPLAHMVEAIPAVAGGIFGMWLCDQPFTILAQLALVSLIAFPVGLSLRPVRAAPVACAVSLTAMLLLTKVFPLVGLSTCAAFSVPLVFGLFAFGFCRCLLTGGWTAGDGEFSSAATPGRRTSACTCHNGGRMSQRVTHGAL